MENDVNDHIDSLSQINASPPPMILSLSLLDSPSPHPRHNKRPLFNTRPVPSFKRPLFRYTSSLRLLKLIDAPKVS